MDQEYFMKNMMRLKNIFVPIMNLSIKYKGLDPEFIGGDVFTPGIDPRDYPVVRTLNIGIDMTF